MSHKNVEGTITQLNNNNIGAYYAHFCPQCALHYDKKKSLCDIYIIKVL